MCFFPAHSKVPRTSMSMYLLALMRLLCRRAGASELCSGYVRWSCSTAQTACHTGGDCDQTRDDRHKGATEAMHCKQYGHTAETCHEHYLRCVSTRVCICFLCVCLCVCQSVDVEVTCLHDLSVTLRFHLACFRACACICALDCMFVASVCVRKCVCKLVLLRV